MSRSGGWLAGWRPALKLARRDALRARGRSLLVLLMIALPVLAVSAAAVVQATADVSGIEGADRRMGAAEARVRPVGGAVFQSPDPEDYGAGGWGTEGESAGPVPSYDAVTAVLGDVRAITLREGWTEIPLGERRVSVNAREVDLRDPLAAGLFTITAGRAAAAADEAVVNDVLVERGVALGDTVTVGDRELEVVGSGVHATIRDTATVDVLPDALGPAFADYTPDVDWLVGGDAVMWSDVLALNRSGLLVTSRAVLADPPPVHEMAEQMGYDTGYGDALAIIALVVTMALLEVVLLAGPAFAVSARRQARSLALMAATGGTPRQARRVVLASGIVLGSLAALAGAVLGVVVGWALLPLAQRWSGEWFGPLDVDWRIVAVVAAFGLLSALLAAVVPAHIASRQDVVAVLAGRRGDRPPSARTPVLGVLLLVAGVALSAYGVSASTSGHWFIAIAAIVSVLGMILVVPVVVALVARLARRLPLALRYAARDAARHRTRTVPAVAAVAATVAGVVTLGIAVSSDEAQSEASYSPSLPLGAAMVNVFPSAPMNGSPEPVSAATWDEVGAAVRARVDDVEVVRGVQQQASDGSYLSVDFREPGDRTPLLEYWGGRLDGSLVVADTVPGVAGLEGEALDAAESALAAGSAVVFAQRPADADTVRVRLDSYDETGDGGSTVRRLAWPATYVDVGGDTPVVQALVPTDLAAELDHPVGTAGIYLPDPGLDEDAQTDLDEALGGITADASLYVERGYQAPDEVVVVQLVLAALGGVLMLGGTLTATFLALSDARPDLATLAAVGAAPRTRRGIAASYALVVGFVGALLGAVVGFIPGIAITWPLTYIPADQLGSSGEATGPYLDVPWLLVLGLVVALPLVTAAVVGLTARSRLPLVTRLD
ncbi:FtsX-like permease family protein [Nocardioides terrigena]|uniref:FtsX-like permease family protein n=1 Tax=Nocardioides terrigena TaxID=424797 RepID=UPI000D30AEAF|nr:FtsX-like permease family protein [Nocardioides terrigena]